MSAIHKKLTLLAAGGFFAVVGHTVKMPFGGYIEALACGCFLASVFAKGST